MPGLTQPERYHLVAPLPSLGGWRRVLALDRRKGPAGPVVLSFPPAALLEDPQRLAALARDAEAGARLQHPNVVPVLGLEVADDQPVLVEPYRPGTTLRALLDASGRLPVELAVRLGCDGAAGLAALHAVDPGDGQPFAHGAIGAERILVGEDGASLIEGVGAGAGRSQPDDVRALAAALVEAVAGEPPASPPTPLEAPGVPPALSALLDRVLCAAPGAPVPTARAFGEALAAAQPPASIEAVAVYVAAVGPPAVFAPPPMPEPVHRPESGPRAASAPSAFPPPVPSAPDPSLSEAPEVSAELLAPEPEPLPADAAVTFPVPASQDRRRKPLVLILGALALVGFVVGFAVARSRAAAQAAALIDRSVEAPPVPEPPRAAAPALPAARTTAAAPEPAVASAPEPPAVAPAARKPATPSLSVTAVPSGEVLVDGKVVGHAPVVVEVKAGEHEVRLRDRGLGVDVRRKVVVRAAATPVRFALARGTLEVTAPDDTEVWVDGRRVGLGPQHVELWEGWHEVEVRRGGARAHERFELTSEVTRWTYDVTPTP